METQPQDTHPQDPIDRIALRIEEMRRDSVARGPMRVLHKLFLDFFMGMMRLLASLAEQRRNGTLPEWAPAPMAEQPRAWPADLRPRESGWVEHRYPREACGGRAVYERFEQPEVAKAIAEAPGEKPGIEQPTGASPPRQSRVGKLKADCEPVAVRSRPAHDGYWPRLRGPALVSTGNAGFLRVDSKKWVLPRSDNCVQFVTV